MMQDRALIDACRRGDLSSCRQLTERHGERATRAAFLLTGGDPTSAGSLAANGTLDALHRIRTGDEEDFPILVAREIARRFLENRPLGHQSGVARVVTAPDSERSRFAVENERSRTRSALALLDPAARVSVVLRLYCRLAAEDVAVALDEPAVGYSATFDQTVERLCAHLDLESERDLVLALATATFDAPRLDIWAEIEPDVEQRIQREERRRRTINAVSAAVVIVGLLAGVLILSGAFSSGDDPAETAAAQGERVTSGVLPTVPLVEPTATSTPQAEVADLLLALNGGPAHAGAQFFEPGQDADRPIIPDGALEAGPPVVAPDGRRVVMLWYEFEDGQAQGYAALFGPDLREMHWKISIASAPYDPDSASRPDFMMAAALDHERVFVALHPWQSWDPIEIQVLDGASGERLETIQTNIAGVVGHDVRLHAPPGHNAVYLYSITNEAPASDGHMRISFLAYRASDGEQILGRILRDVPDSRSFFLYRSRLSRDGDHLFGVDYTDARRETAVHFFNLRRGEIEPRVKLPFQPVADPLPVQQVVSHDGRWLYVLSSASLELAVIDLDARRLQGIIPLDSGVLGGSAVDVVYTRDQRMQLSPDGRRLYAIGASIGEEFARPAGVWVIDTSTWTVVQHLASETQPAQLLLDGDGRTLFIKESGSSLSGSQERLYAMDVESGSVEQLSPPHEGRFSVATLAALYRDRYAVSPWVDGQAPLSVTGSRPLASARVEIEPERAEAGQPVAVEVRFVHPLDGSPVEETAADDARFRPPAFVRATFEPEDGGNSTIIDLGTAEYGIYRGVAILPDAGQWSLRVELDWPAGQIIDRTLLVPEALRVLAPEAPAIHGGIGHLAIR